MKLSNKLYDILKWGLTIFIPAVITFSNQYFSLDFMYLKTTD